MTRTDLKFAAIANVAAWFEKHRRDFLDDGDAMASTRRHFDHLPASIVVAAVLIAQDGSDEAFWLGMEVAMQDAAPMVSALDAAFSTKEADLDAAIPF